MTPTITSDSIPDYAAMTPGDFLQAVGMDAAKWTVERLIKRAEYHERLAKLHHQEALDEANDDVSAIPNYPPARREEAASKANLQISEDILSLIHSLATVTAENLKLREASEPFALVWEYDDAPRHFPEAIHMLSTGVRLNLMNDDMRRASEAARAARSALQPPTGETE